MSMKIKRTAADEDSGNGGQTCSVCGASIERDPEGEEPRTWHHNDGDKHDHEAKPSGGDKEAASLTELFNTEGWHPYGVPSNKTTKVPEGRGITQENWDRASEDASLGVGHVWTNTRCPAYATMDPADCNCQKTSARRVGALNDLMEFDHPVVSDGNGNVTDAPSNIYAPEVYVELDDEGQQTSLDPSDIHVSSPWMLLNGFSGQDRYPGPIMHPSEYVGGGLETYIRENPGVYATVVVSGIGGPEGEDDVVGWAVAYIPKESRRAAIDYPTDDDDSIDDFGGGNFDNGEETVQEGGTASGYAAAGGGADMPYDPNADYLPDTGNPGMYYTPDREMSVGTRPRGGARRGLNDTGGGGGGSGLQDFPDDDRDELYSVQPNDPEPEQLEPSTDRPFEEGGYLAPVADYLNKFRQAPASKRTAADDESSEGGQTCSVCGASIERDPAGEEPRTWHHNDGDKHDHEAKPSGGDKESMRKGAPFADYKDFEDCVSKNSDKDDPDAYCGYIKHKVEDKKSSKVASDDLLSRARSIAESAGSASISRLSGTDLNALADMASSQDDETVKWARTCASAAGSASVSRFSGTDLKKLIDMAKQSRKRMALSLTNVGIDGPGVGIGTDPSGARVKFRLSDKDESDLKSVLYSDLGMNFSGVEIEQSDIIENTARKRGRLSAKDITAANRELQRFAEHKTEGPYKVQVAGIGEHVWSENALRFDTPEEAKSYASDLLGRWFGADMARVVPSDTPTRAPVEPGDTAIVINYRTGARRRAMAEIQVHELKTGDILVAADGRIDRQNNRVAKVDGFSGMWVIDFTNGTSTPPLGNGKVSVVRERTAAKYRGDLDRSVAFSILLDVMPGYGESVDDGGATITAFLNDWYEDPGTDMYAFAQGWVAGRTARKRAVKSRNCENGNHSICTASSCTCSCHAKGTAKDMSGACGEGDHDECKMSHGLGDDDCQCPVCRNKTAKQAAGPKSAVAGEGAYVTDQYNSGIREDVAAGTIAHGRLVGMTMFGESYAWSVDGVSGDMWSLGGNWSETTTATRRTAARSLSEIAAEIRRDWKNVEYSAAPYLDAMRQLDSINDNYGADSAKSIVAYFLVNASKWRGETAKRVKAELRAMGSKTASNYYLDMIEDSDGNLVDIEYYHRFCAPEELKAKGDWPAPEFPDYDVYCAGCGELIHSGIDSEARLAVTEGEDEDEGHSVRDPRNPRGLYGGDRNILLQDRALELHDEERRRQLEMEQLERSGARSDYEHWNEDADYMWWQEEGRHEGEPPEEEEFYDDWSHEGAASPFVRSQALFGFGDPDKWGPVKWIPGTPIEDATPVDIWDEEHEHEGALLTQAMPNPADIGVKVGDFFVHSWGYDQTNIDFYEVTGLTGQSVKVRQVNNDRTPVGGPASYVEKVVPIPGSYKGPEMTKRVKVSGHDGQPYITQPYGWCGLWDGQPRTETSYG